MDCNLEGRQVISSRPEDFEPYAPYGGEPIPGLSWIKLDFDEESRGGLYLLRFEPGAASRQHEHTFVEQFLVVEGELVDCDGAVYRSGDFVRLPAGTRHSSHSPGGCVIAALLKAPNRPISTG